MNKLLVTIWLTVLLCSGTDQASAEAQEDFAEGLEAYNAGKYAEAATWYGLAAEQGLAEAQLLLGSMYYKGQGVAQDYELALYWFAKAAEQGNVEAQTNLGYMYDKAMGVEQDYKKAVSWYRKAAG